MKIFQCIGRAVLVVLLVSCGPSDETCARQLVENAEKKIQQGQWQHARVLLDSVHHAFPREVEQRRRAKVLADSITFLEAKRTASFSDSVLHTLLPEIDPLLKEFRYEKNANYEDYGKYVHRLLSTANNTSRCFLQAYVRDDRVTVVKSYYYGAGKMNQSQLTLSCDGMESLFRGSNHSFDSEGWHEIMTLEDSSALQLLNFVSSHSDAKIRVHGQGDHPNKCWTYYLRPNEVEALAKTYRLGYLMKDIRLLEQMEQKASAQVQWWQNKYHPCVKNGFPN